MTGDQNNSSFEEAKNERVEESGNRVPESEDTSMQITSSTGQEEEAALEDVLIITTDKSLESLDYMVPAEEFPDVDQQQKLLRKKDRGEKV